VVDFFLMKGIVENVLARLDIVDFVFVRPEQALPHLHPGISAIIRSGEKMIGWLGKLHPSYVLEAGLPDTFVFELDLSMILSNESTTILMTEIPKYPSINRDLAVVVKQSITATMLEECIKKAGKGLLKDIRIFDLYQGESIAEGSKSIAITLVFRDNAKTLESADVDKAVERIIKALRSELEAQLRT
jgi:phenylalanyl-tRNA synthetase beta chain